MDEMERRYLRHVLAAVGGNKTRAAQLLGRNRRSLYRRLQGPHQLPGGDGPGARSAAG